MANVQAKRNVVFLGVAEGIGRIGVMLVTAIAARFLPEQQFASYLVIWAVIGILWVVAQLGTSIVGVRELSRLDTYPEKERLVGNMFLARLFMASCVIIFTLVFGQYLVPGAEGILLFIGLSIVVFRAITLDWALRALQKIHAIAILTVVSTLLLCGSGYTVAQIYSNSTSLLLTHGASALLLAVGSIVLVRNSLDFKFSNELVDRKYIAGLLQSSAKVGVAGIAVVSSQAVPLLVINWLGDDSVTAGFGGLQRILQLCLAGLFILSVAHFPELARSSNKNLTLTFRHYVADLMVASFLLFTIFSFYSELTITVVLGENYSQVSRYLPYFMMLVPIYYLRTALTDTLLACQHTKPVLSACVLSLLFTIILSVILIPLVPVENRILSSVGIMGASEVIVLAISVIAISRKKYSVILSGNFKLVMLNLFALLCMATIILVPQLNDWIRLLFAILSIIIISNWLQYSSLWHRKVV